MEPSAEVVGAMAACPREGFLPDRHRRNCGYDGPLDIGHGQTSSQPRTVVDMLMLLDVRPGQRVLDVGAGSGWTTALLAQLVGPSGRVDGVERVPSLVAFGRENLDRAGMPWAQVHEAAAGVLGLPERAPYDRVLVSADAASLPEELVAQLGPGGVLVIPVAGRMLRVVASVGSAHGPDVTVHGFYRFVPLIR